MSKFLLFATLAALAIATTTPSGYCSGPVLSNNICCVNGYRIDDATGGKRCNEYGSTTFLTVPAMITPPSTIIQSTPQEAEEPSSNIPSHENLVATKVFAPLTTSIIMPDSPTPKPTNLYDRQYNTVTFPDGNGIGSVAYPDSGVFSNPYGGGYGSYGANGYNYNGNGVTIAGSGNGVAENYNTYYEEGPGVGYGGYGYQPNVGNGYNNYVQNNGIGNNGYINGGGYNGYYGNQMPAYTSVSTVAMTVSESVVSWGPNGPYTATEIYKGGAVGGRVRKGLGVGVFGGMLLALV